VLWSFGGSIERLIPLYAFGVFSAFTLSQSGMVVRWWRRREPGWQRSIIFNGVGALATFIVLLVVAWTKFIDGAWMVVVLLPLLILMFRAIHAHYIQADVELAAETPIDPEEISHQVIVPIATLNQVALQTLAYARSIARDADDVVGAVHVTDDPEAAESLRLQWEEWQCGVQLTIVESPFRSLVGPLLAYIDAMHAQFPHKTLTVILPEMVPAHWWEQVLHNQTALRLKAALLFRPGIVVASVPYHLRRYTPPAAVDGSGPNGKAPKRKPDAKSDQAGHRTRRVVRPAGPQAGPRTDGHRH
jgi:hypothetical protein